MNQSLFDYIAACPTAYHAVSHTAAILRNAGYTELPEHTAWNLEGGKGYFVTRNGSSLIAFRAPVTEDFSGFMMTAAHGDSPCFKIKENAEMSDGHHLRLSVEKYGGMLCSSWTDRPLSVAGRVIVRAEGGIATRLVDLVEPCAIIPNVAIHMNRNANDGMSYNPAVDMIPLCGEASDAGFLRKEIADELDIREEDIEVTAHRSSGAGGQHINKTDSAIRIVHKPTGIVVGCQTERSQLQNKETALKMLKAKLMEIKIREKLDRIEDIQGNKANIEWGSQIRSYVFMPYTLAKDTRTGYEDGNIDSVMDGNIDGFINAFLKQNSDN